MYKTDFKIEMPKEVSMIIGKLSDVGHEAVIIGGCVRDSIMGITPNDWDIATSAQPNEIIECFNEYNILTAGLKHGTVTVIIDHEPYEITTYRVDGEYSDHRRPDVVSFTNNLEEDILRRDFTINAIAYDGNNIIDLHNGIDDIKNEIIRCVGSADNRFKEDPLRIMRAIRFSSKFGFEIESNTKEAMMGNCILLKYIAIERIQSEFTKALCGNHVSVLKGYREILNNAIPCLLKIEKDFDVIIDTISDCKDICERLAVLIDGLGITRYNKDVRAILSEMRYPNRVISSVENILSGSRMMIVDSDICAKNMLYRFSHKDVKHILQYKYAKIKNTNKNKMNFAKDIKHMIMRVDNLVNQGECYNFKSLDINGRDLKNIGINDLEIKSVLEKLLELVITKQVENKKELLIEVVEISNY